MSTLPSESVTRFGIQNACSTSASRYSGAVEFCVLSVSPSSTAESSLAASSASNPSAFGSIMADSTIMSAAARFVAIVFTPLAALASIDLNRTTPKLFMPNLKAGHSKEFSRSHLKLVDAELYKFRSVGLLIVVAKLFSENCIALGHSPCCRASRARLYIVAITAASGRMPLPCMSLKRHVSAVPGTRRLRKLSAIISVLGAEGRSGSMSAV